VERLERVNLHSEIPLIQAILVLVVSLLRSRRHCLLHRQLQAAFRRQQQAAFRR
jgi:hypothetical protein